MIGRRGLITGGTALLLAAGDALPVPPSNRLLFQVVRGGSVMHVSFGPIPLFHYRHHALESWDGDQCVSVVSQTDHNGEQLTVSAKRDATGWSVDGSKGHLRAPPDALPATHWNKKMLRGPMINTETGSVMHPHIADLGQDQVLAYMTAPITAEHYVMSGDAQMDTWYDAAPSWAGARFKGGDGSDIRYERA